MEERRIFSSDGMKNASILFWRPLSDILDSKLSSSAREKRIYDFFITAENLSILHKPPFIWDSQILAGKVGTKARDSFPLWTTGNLKLCKNLDQVQKPFNFVSFTYSLNQKNVIRKKWPKWKLTGSKNFITAGSKLVSPNFRTIYSTTKLFPPVKLRLQLKKRLRSGPKMHFSRISSNFFFWNKNLLSFFKNWLSRLSRQVDCTLLFSSRK